MIEEFVSRAFYTRDLAHWEHWRTKSFSQHEALGEFYEELITSVDSVVEAYQGRFDIVGPLPVPNEYAGDIIKHLEADRDWLEENRDELAQGITALENLIDTVSDLYLRTIYKLERFK
ncbi:hypothetical protein [Caulobacter phage KcrB]|nr:hypothetical protein RW_GP074c [Caulobacter phage RW]WCA46378.1 hypothetical protein [Caulobacter phage KcrB]WCD56313.1 hypothetical protein [Caulobacter phage RLK]WNV48105.1 transcrptional regulator [Caulobacter phage GB2A]